MKDELGQRMKADYEDALRLYVPRRTHVVIRIDGRAFHRFTNKLERPYCRRLADALDSAAVELAAQMIGCRFAYGQSDEYSFVLTDTEPADAALWFDGNVQKIVSVSASVFTGAFNRAFSQLPDAESGGEQPAAFDSRILVIAQRSEVEKYLLWRQLDASANSLNMLASAYFPHKDLMGRSTAEKHEMLHGIGINWAKQPSDFKRGRTVVRETGGGWRVDREIPVFNREPGYLAAALGPHAGP
jgi:tRNA(His) 5'-end guanylyltransferase